MKKTVFFSLLALFIGIPSQAGVLNLGSGDVVTLTANTTTTVTCDGGVIGGGGLVLPEPPRIVSKSCLCQNLIGASNIPLVLTLVMSDGTVRNSTIMNFYWLNDCQAAVKSSAACN